MAPISAPVLNSSNQSRLCPKPLPTRQATRFRSSLRRCGITVPTGVALLTRFLLPIEQHRWAKKGKAARWRLLPAGATLQVLRGAKEPGVRHRQLHCCDGAQGQGSRQQRRFPWLLLARLPPGAWCPPSQPPVTEPLQPSILLLSAAPRPLCVLRRVGLGSGAPPPAPGSSLPVRFLGTINPGRRRDQC